MFFKTMNLARYLFVKSLHIGFSIHTNKLTPGHGPGNEARKNLQNQKINCIFKRNGMKPKHH